MQDSDKSVLATEEGDALLSGRKALAVCGTADGLAGSMTVPACMADEGTEAVLVAMVVEAEENCPCCRRLPLHLQLPIR